MNCLTLLFLMGVLALAVSLPAGAAETMTASLSMNGRVRIASDQGELGTVAPVLAGPAWNFVGASSASYRQEGPVRRFNLKLADTTVAGEAVLWAEGGGASARYAFTAAADTEVACLGVGLEFPAADLIGHAWKAGDKQGTFPAERGAIGMFNGLTQQVVINTKGGRSLTISFPKPTPVLIQDNRQWGPTFSIRIGQQGGKISANQRYELPFTLKVNGPISVKTDAPVTIQAGADWVPLKTELEIEPGSALDFSKMGFAEGPCGKFGKIIVSPEGHFVFANDPGKTPRRFYGVNFCFGAQYISHEQADQLCDRLLRLGYNTIRLHHYESALTNDQPGFSWDLKKLDQLDYLLAACRKRGIYVTTDLYVSRPVSAQQVQMPGNDKWAYKFKVLVPVHEPAFKDWETFTRKFLDRVNPHTGLRLAEDPTLAWLSMINEGNIGNYWGDVKQIPQWTTAWNKWLWARYPNREAVARNWGAELKAQEDPAGGSVALPGNFYGSTPRHRDCQLFAAETERAMFLRMEKFLREEIRCSALLTYMNAWTNHVPNQLARAEMDYVDDHFYVDHPQFLERDWNLPSRCNNENPVKIGAPGGRPGNAIRLLGKPFTVSEYNYSGPGRFRGVGGILTGAQAALQDWDVIWRFAYAHSSQSLFTPGRMGYFDLATDPLNQAADRAAVALYLRGDLKTAPNTVAMVLAEKELTNLPNHVPTMGEAPHWLAWVTKLGSSVVRNPADAPKGSVVLRPDWAQEDKPATGLSAFKTDRGALVAALKEKGVLKPGNLTDPARNIYQSETGEMLLDATRGVLSFDTERTAGGYAEPGQSLSSSRAGVEISDLSIGATVFVTSIDSKPIRNSSRLLVTHLTDLQNTGTTYAEEARQTLLEWGKLPHLVRDGSATVKLMVKDPSSWVVYSLSTSGKRLGEVPAKVQEGRLTFACSVRSPEGARMLYEVTKR